MQTKFKESPILTTVVQSSLFAIKLLAIWIFLRGHQEPGGGFVAGLVISAAIAIQGLAFGYDAADSILPVPFYLLLAGGLTFAFSTVFLPTLFGEAFMQHYWGPLDLPLLGHIEWATAAVFDLGVMLVVVGTMKATLLFIASEKRSTAPGESEPAARRR
ncbi:MAG: MnhB domain-containing protein [Bacillota bacterium]